MLYREAGTFFFRLEQLHEKYIYTKKSTTAALHVETCSDFFFHDMNGTGSKNCAIVDMLSKIIPYWTQYCR
jgi:hypothetical protein